MYTSRIIFLSFCNWTHVSIISSLTDNHLYGYFESPCIWYTFQNLYSCSTYKMWNILLNFKCDIRLLYWNLIWRSCWSIASKIDHAQNDRYWYVRKSVENLLKKSCSGRFRSKNVNIIRLNISQNINILSYFHKECKFTFKLLFITAQLNNLNMENSHNTFKTLK